jgi:hypothetical protein
MTKTTWITLLVCVNLILLTGVTLFAYTPRTALAQGTALSGNYVVVSGKIQTNLDALYLIDLRERTLHTFYFEQGTNELKWAGYRDLERDFRNNP